MSDHYILDDEGNAVEEEDLVRWEKLFEGSDRHLGDETVNGYRVSTIFLGLDHSFGNGPPLLWETMIFGDGCLNEIQERYSTRAEALEGHKRWMAVAGGEVQS